MKFSMDNDNLSESLLQSAPRLNLAIVSVVCLALFADSLLLTIVVPLLPALLGSEYSTLSIGVVFASKPVCQFIANPFMSSLVDKYGPKVPLLAGVLVLVLSSFLFAYGMSFSPASSLSDDVISSNSSTSLFLSSSLSSSISAYVSPSSVTAVSSGSVLSSSSTSLSSRSDLEVAYYILLCARSVQGLASAATMPAAMTLCAKCHDPSLHGSAMGIAMTGLAFGVLAGPPLGGIIGGFVNLWAPFVIVGCVLVVDLAAQIYTFKSTNFHYDEIMGDDDDDDEDNGKEGKEGESKPSPGGVAKLITHMPILIVCVSAITANGMIGLAEPLVPVYLDEQFGLDLTMQGLVFGFATLSYLLFTPLAGFISDRFARWQCICLGLFVMGCGMLCLSLSGVSLALACVGLVFLGGGLSFVDTPSLPLIADIVKDIDPKSLGAGYALNDMAISVGFIGGPIVGPLLAESLKGGGTSGFRYATFIASLLCFSLAPLGFYLKKYARNNDDEQNYNNDDEEAVDF